MVGKVSLGARAAGVISYCYFEQDQPQEEVIRGELLYSNEVWEARHPNGELNLASLAAQFHQTAALNRDTTKFIWHQTFSFPPGEKVTNETMVKIARDFAKDFGFEDNQYLVFRHRDKAHEHFHIIANRINGEGKNTASDQHNYERIQVFSRQMEQKYGLSVTENHQQKVDSKHNRENPRLEQIRKVVDGLLPQSHSLSELSLALKKKGIVLQLGRGVAFTDQWTGTSFKGSDLGREYSRAHLEKRLGKDLSQANAKPDRFDGLQRQALRETIDRVVGQTIPNHTKLPREAQQGVLNVSWNDFGERLKKEGVTLKLVRDEPSGRIKGAAFQTGERRYVNSRELGEAYTVKALALRFGRTPQELDRLLVELKDGKAKTGRENETMEEKTKEMVVVEASTKVIAGPNAAGETKSDLAKIAESQRAVEPKKHRRRIK